MQSRIASLFAAGAALMAGASVGAQATSQTQPAAKAGPGPSSMYDKQEREAMRSAMGSGWSGYRRPGRGWSPRHVARMKRKRAGVLQNKRNHR